MKINLKKAYDEYSYFFDAALIIVLMIAVYIPV